MKNHVFIFIFLSFTLSSVSQNFIETTTINSTATKNVSHFGTLTIGSSFESIYDPWRAVEGRLIDLYKPTGNISMRIGNNLGKLSINVSNCNGCFYPKAASGNIVIRSHSTNKVFFSLNNINDDGKSAFIFGDNKNFNTLNILNNGKIGIGTGSPQEKLHINGSIRGNATGGALKIKSQHGYIDVGANLK